MDTIIIRDCRFSCHIGVSAAERKARQPVLMDVELSFDTKKAGKSDRIEDTVHYIDVYEAVKRAVEERPYALVETLAADAAALILERFPVKEVSLTVKKTKPMRKRGGAWAGVSITRSR